MRLTPVMLALLLALSPVAVAVQTAAPTAPATAHSQSSTAQSPVSTARPLAATDSAPAQTGSDAVQPSPEGNTTAVLTLGTDPAQTGFDRPSLALGSSLATDHGGFRSQLSINTLDQQLQAAETTEKKKQILNRYRYRIENRIISLKAEERRATHAFSNGTMSKTEYLRTLGRIDAEAGEIRDRAETMRKRAQPVPQFRMKTEANTLKAKLLTLEGPVRNRVARAVQGQSPPTKVYVAVSDAGVVLSTVAGNTYIREIVRMDKRNPGASESISMQEAQQRIIQKYSWAWNNSESWGTNSLYGTTNIYQMHFQHVHGELFVYHDGGTEEVFKEVQYKRLTGENSVPAGPGVTNSSNNLTLVVNRTYPGGPLRVNLTNESGVPLQGQISVAGEPAGRTHADGTLWALGPAHQFRVSATYRGRTVNVTARPTKKNETN